jgi:hypothetical protein
MIAAAIFAAQNPAYKLARHYFLIFCNHCKTKFRAAQNFGRPVRFF